MLARVQYTHRDATHSPQRYAPKLLESLRKTPSLHQLRILALGASLTEGSAHPLSGSRTCVLTQCNSLTGAERVPYSLFLPALLAPHLAPDWSADVANHGVSGETTGEIKLRAPTDSKWDVVVLLAGTNDLGKYEVDPIWHNLCEMYTKFEAAGATVVAVTIPNIRIVRFTLCGALRSAR